MKRILSLFLTLTVVLSAVALLASCANYSEKQELQAYYVDNLYDFDPATNFTNDDALEVLNLIYEPLFTYDEDGKLVGALVEKYSYDESSRVLTLTLRTTCWNDGTDEIEGEDLIFAWKRILACDFACEAAPLLYDVENAYECKASVLDTETEMPIGVDDLGLSVDVKNSKNVFVTLREGADIDRFLRNLTAIALTPLDEDTVAGTRSSYWATRTATLKTSGPFAVKVIEHSVGYFKLGRNQFYRVSENAEKIDMTKYVLPALLSTTWTNANDIRLKNPPTARLNTAFLNLTGQLEETALEDTIFFMGTVPLAQRAKYGTEEWEYSADVVTGDSLSTYSYVFNMNNPSNPLVNNTVFRKAISDVISRTALAQKLVFAKPATGLVTDGVYHDGLTGNFRADNAILSTEAVNATAAKNTIRSLINALPEEERAAARKLTLLCRNTEEDQEIAKAVKQALSDTITVDFVPLSYTYITPDIASEESVDAEQVIFAFDALNLAYTPDAEGNLYYYAYNDSLRANPMQYDMIGLDLQMLTTDAFAVLASFSSNYNGNGINTNEVDGNFSYNVNKPTCGWSNAFYDAWVEKAYEAENSTDRATYLHEAEKVLLSEMPVIPLVFNQNCAVVHSSLQGVTVTPHYGYFNMTRVFVKDPDKELDIIE